MQRHKLGAVIVFILTICLTVLVYNVTFDINLDKAELQRVIAKRLSAFNSLPLKRPFDNIEICTMQTFRGSTVVLFRLQDKREWNGLLVLRKGFNQRWQLETLQIGNNYTVQSLSLRAGGQKTLLLYAAALPSKLESLEVVGDDQSGWLTYNFEADYCLLAVEAENSPRLWQYYQKNNYLPKLRLLDEQGFNIYNHGIQNLQAISTWQIREDYKVSSTWWAVLVLLVGIVLIIEQWEYDKLHRSYLMQSKASRILSVMWQRHNS